MIIINHITTLLLLIKIYERFIIEITHSELFPNYLVKITSLQSYYSKVKVKVESGRSFLRDTDTWMLLSS